MGGIGLLAFIVVMGLYGWYFQESKIIAKTEFWGQFGDYMGGVLNPFVALLAFMALLYTIVQNQEELELTRIELTKTAEAATKQAEHRSGPRCLDSSISEISAFPYATCCVLRSAKYTVSGVCRFNV